jgi:uncharacterized protein (TIRG00374 family)
MSIRKIVLGLLVSAICLYFVLRNVNWDEVWQHLQQVNVPLFFLSMLLMLLAYFLMTWRWQLLLDPLEIPDSHAVRRDGAVLRTGVRGHASLVNLYGKVMTGYFFNAFFPARAGDLVRAYLLGRKTGLRKTTILATIVIEKAFDGIALLLILLVSLILLPPLGTSASTGIAPDVLAWASGIVLLGAIAGLILFYRYSDSIARFTERLLTRLHVPDRLRRLPVRLIETFAGGMHIFKTPRPLISAALISLVVWVVVAFMFLAALASFRSPFPTELMSVGGLLFMTALVNLGLLIPALPGNVGTYELLCVAAMAVFKVDKELAVAFALVFHVGQLVVTLAVGLVAFWAQNMTLSEMRPMEKKAEAEAQTALEEVETEGLISTEA